MSSGPTPNGEILEFLNEVRDYMSKRFDRVEEHLTLHDHRFDAIDRRLDAHEVRIESLDKHRTVVDTELKGINSRLGRRRRP